MKLKELVQKNTLLQRMYAQVTDFDRVLKVDALVDEIEKHLKAYNKALDAIKKLDADKQEKELEKLLEKDINLELVSVTQDEVKGAQFNVFEYRMIKKFIV